MTQNNPINRPPLSAWQTQLIRLTAFPSPLMTVANQNWWEEVVGELPTTQKREPKTFEQSDEGPYKNGRLILNVSPLRIDWGYTVPEVNPNESRAKLPVLGSFEQVLNDFSDLIQRWLSIPNLILVRLAFGSVLLQEVDSDAKGHLLVSSYLPFALDPENTSDLLYRINRKRPSETLNGLVINRLSTWNAISTPRFALRVSLGHAMQGSFFEPIYAAQLELDISTAHDYADNLPPEKLGDIFLELTKLGIEIAQEGDIP